MPATFRMLFGIFIMTTDLRKNIKKRLIDLDLDRSYKPILPALSEKVGREISNNTLSMALSGFRQGKAYQEILAALDEMLSKWPNEAA
jgi:hypothetical protein